MATLQDLKDRVDSLRADGLKVVLNHQDFGNKEKFVVIIKAGDLPEVNGWFSDPESAIDWIDSFGVGV